MGSGIINTHGTVISATWSATETTAYNVVVTQDLVFPTSGVWLILVSLPNVTGGAGVALTMQASQNISFPIAQNIFPVVDMAKYCIVGKVNNPGSIIRLVSGSGYTTTYSNLDRGGLSAVKVV